MRDTATVDCETTSLRDPHLPGGRRVWEFAVIRRPAGGARAMCAWVQITDVDLTDADPFSLRIGRFDERFAPGRLGPIGPTGTLEGRAAPVELWGLNEHEGAQLIHQLTDGAVIAGSNPAFDMASFADLLRRHGCEPGWYHHPRDIPNMAHGALNYATGGAWAAATYPTGVLSDACGVPVPEDRHSAWADAAWMDRWDARLRRGLVSTRPKTPSAGILPA